MSVLYHNSRVRVMRRWRLHIVVVLVGLLLSACDVTRDLTQGEYLLQSVKIKEDESVPRKERIRSDDVLKYVRQTPNKRFLGMDFYVWVYSLANPKRDNWWNNFKRKVGERPVILNDNETRRSLSNLKIARGEPCRYPLAAQACQGGVRAPSGSRLSYLEPQI